MSDTDDRFYFESEQDSENQLTAYINENGDLRVSVADIQAIGSYNEWFDLSVDLSPHAAKELRDYLNRKFPG